MREFDLNQEGEFEAILQYVQELGFEPLQVKEDLKSFKLLVTEDVLLTFEFSMSSFDLFLFVAVKYFNNSYMIRLNWPMEGTIGLNSNCSIRSDYQNNVIVFSEFISFLKKFEYGRRSLC